MDVVAVFSVRRLLERPLAITVHSNKPVWMHPTRNYQSFAGVLCTNSPETQTVCCLQLTVTITFGMHSTQYWCTTWPVWKSTSRLLSVTSLFSAMRCIMIWLHSTISQNRQSSLVISVLTRTWLPTLRWASRVSRPTRHVTAHSGD